MSRLEIKYEGGIKRLFFKLRGIYSTALTAVLIDEEMKPTQISEVIRSRFNLPNEVEPHDVMIIDTDDLQGIKIRGKKEAVDKVLNRIREVFPYTVIWRCKPQLNAIYIGVVKEVAKDNEYIVDLGESKGILRTINTYNEGDKVLVCVKRTYYGKPCELSENITLVGRYARIMLGGRHTVSPHIRDPERRAELLALAYSMSTGKWGIRWRSSAEHGDLTVIAKEIQELIKEGEKIIGINKEGAPRLIKEGEEVAYVRFTVQCKLKADEIRNTIVPTVIGHHYLKSNIEDPELVDFSEFLMMRGFDRLKVSEELLTYLKGKIRPQTGHQVKIIHYTLDNKAIYLTPGTISRIDNGIYTIRRVFRNYGMHDGLNIEKKPGDYALTYLAEGSWWLVHEYHRENGEYLGMYCNVNTPIEIWGNRIYYIDLAVDVVKDVKGDIKVLDVDELDEARNEDIVSEKLYKKALELAEFAKIAMERTDNAEELIQILLAKQKPVIPLAQGSLFSNDCAR